MSSIDEIIELYKRDVDMTLIEESLKHTPEDRILALEKLEAALASHHPYLRSQVWRLWPQTGR
jgi:hypothetical protein